MNTKPKYKHKIVSWLPDYCKVLSYSVLLCVVVAFSCSRKSHSDLLVVSVEPQRWILEQLVGDKYNVVSLMTRDADAENFEPTMQTRMAVDDAAVFFTTGVLPFEEKIAGTLDNAEVVDTSVGIKLIYGTHGHEHHHPHGDCTVHGHGTPDPHTWVSITNMRSIAGVMHRQLVKMHPEHKTYFDTRFKVFNERLDSADNAIKNKLGNVPVKAFAVWHPSLSYFARDYGLEQISVGFENKEISAKRLAETTKLTKDKNVKVFIYEKTYGAKQAEMFAQNMDGKTIEINPMSPDIIETLVTVADGIAQAQ